MHTRAYRRSRVTKTPPLPRLHVLSIVGTAFWRTRKISLALGKLSSYKTERHAGLCGEMVDAPDSKSGSERSGGSSPSTGTSGIRQHSRGDTHMATAAAEK